MGAWGAGSFENDTAMDWTYGVKSVADVSKVFERLKQETDAHPNGGAMHLGADFACELVAAAECVAMMMGRIVPDFPEEVKEVLAEAGEPDALLFHQARNAVTQLTRHSELAELWEEAAEDNEPNPWLEEITQLVDRLNPDIEYTPPEQPEIAEEDSDESGPICLFCRKTVAKSEFFGLTITDYRDMSAYERIVPIHLRCLNARVPHSVAILDWKDDPDREIDLDLL